MSRAPAAARPLLFSRDMVPEDDVRTLIPAATYREPVDGDEEGNSWLLALELPIESRKELRRRLTTEVQVTQADRDSSPFRRQQLLLRMRRFVHPLGTLRVFYEHIVLMMHEGYVSRHARTHRQKQGRGARRASPASSSAGAALARAPPPRQPCH